MGGKLMDLYIAVVESSNGGYAPLYGVDKLLYEAALQSLETTDLARTVYRSKVCTDGKGIKVAASILLCYVDEANKAGKLDVGGLENLFNVGFERVLS
jgi:hypothetical protein